MPDFAPQQILCPVDLSSASSSVLSWARLFAHAFGSRVEILHADWSDSPRYFTEEQLATLSAQAAARRKGLRRNLEELARKALGADVAFTVSVVEGHAVEVVLRHMRAASPGLIIMGSHGHSGVARLLLGSVAENVAREAHCPTLIVKGSEISAVRRILCPVNLTNVARESALISSAIARAFVAELSILQSLEDSNVPQGEARQQLCRWIPEAASRHCQVSQVLVQGDAAEQIILFARDHGTDLIVLGAEHRSFLEFTTLGRTTERVLHHAPCPVLLIPQKR